MPGPRRHGGMTGRQIAAANKREREDLAARLAIEEAVHGGPFDEDTDLDGPADETPPLGSCTGAADCPVVVHIHGCFADQGSCDAPDEHRASPTAPQAELRARLDAATAPEAVEAGRFAPAPGPKIVDGLIVPAQSVADSTTATWVLVPVGEVASIGLTGRAVGITPHHGRWLAVWIGDRHADRDAVFEQFATDLAEARRSRR